MNEIYKNMDSSVPFDSVDEAALESAKDPLFQKRTQMSDLRAARRRVTHDMEMSYGLLGSLFRSGSRPTFFASQVGHRILERSFAFFFF
jgi:hypothetical protein